MSVEEDRLDPNRLRNSAIESRQACLQGERSYPARTGSHQTESFVIQRLYKVANIFLHMYIQSNGEETAAARPDQCISDAYLFRPPVRATLSDRSANTPNLREAIITTPAKHHALDEEVNDGMGESISRKSWRINRRLRYVEMKIKEALFFWVAIQSSVACNRLSHQVCTSTRGEMYVNPFSRIQDQWSETFILSGNSRIIRIHSARERSIQAPLFERHWISTLLLSEGWKAPSSITNHAFTYERDGGLSESSWSCTSQSLFQKLSLLFVLLLATCVGPALFLLLTAALSRGV